MERIQLEIFLDLVETKSFTQTAKNLNYSQPNISSQIRKLEEELEGELFNRLGKRISLTSRGQHFLPFAKQIVSLSSKAIQETRDHKEQTIRILVSESLCLAYLTKVISSFKEKYPNVSILLQMYQENAASSLQNGDVDFAFILDHPVKNESLKSLFSYEQEICLFGKEKKDTFQSYPLLLTGDGCVYKTLFLEHCQDQGIDVNVALETGSIQVLKEMALCGVGAALLPTCVIHAENLIPWDLPFPLSFYQQILIHKDKKLSSFAQEFIQQLIIEIRANI
ncbi:MAG: LysR family transcriptional regulator [Bacillota bacterium]|nr:LysR family transcriptional regulator [Bacillota bacterium]